MVTVEKILRFILTASTAEDCKVAWQAAHAWIRDHPEDEPLIIAAGRRLAVVQEAIRAVDDATLRMSPGRGSGADVDA